MQPPKYMFEIGYIFVCFNVHISPRTSLTGYISPFVGWLVGWLIGWLVDWLVGWLVDWLIG